MAGEIIIDATNATLGRLASYSAKQALQGKKIIILNAEKSIITGNKKFIINDYQEKKRRKGSMQSGPVLYKLPQKFVKRTIRGMLQHRIGRGKEAYKRILCFKGVPEEYKDKKMIKAGKEKHTAFITVEELAKLM